MRCPGCGHENLPGADCCQQCQTSLMQEDLPVSRPRGPIERSLAEDRVETLRLVAPASVTEDITLAAAVRAMQGGHVGCLLVTDRDGKLRGILTDRDLLNRVAGLVDDLEAHPVGKYMTPRPETILADHPLAIALQRMMVGDHRYLPVIDEEGRSTEAISSHTIIDYLTSLVAGDL